MGRMAKRIRRIGILTGGGDAPGLNAVIRAATLSALERGWEVMGIPNAFAGLYTGRKLRKLNREAVRGIAHLGGTILGTTNQLNPLKVEVNGKEEDHGAKVVRAAKKAGLDAVIAIGGDGTLGIGHSLAQRGMRLIGVPKTIDNDVRGTVVTFGFDTAVATATDALDKLHPTAAAHRRVMVVEVMGRNAGWIALHSGVAGTADVILLPEIPFTLEAVVEKIRLREKAKCHFTIVVAAEGAKPRGGRQVLKEAASAGKVARLGGIAEWLAAELGERTGKSARSIVLGHLQRGGSPTTFDRLLSTRMGSGAVRALEAGHTDVMVALRPPKIAVVPLATALKGTKRVPKNHDIIQSARDLGIYFGDELD